MFLLLFSSESNHIGDPLFININHIQRSLNYTSTLTLIKKRKENLMEMGLWKIPPISQYFIYE